MKIFAVSLVLTMIVTTSSMAFDLPSTSSLSTENVKLKTCLLQEAQQALANGTLTKDNVESQAAKIATLCATKVAVKNDATTVQLATTIIKGLVK